jgi:hypothetical protein
MSGKPLLQIWTTYQAAVRTAVLRHMIADQEVLFFMLPYDGYQKKMWPIFFSS